MNPPEKSEKSTSLVELDLEHLDIGGVTFMYSRTHTPVFDINPPSMCLSESRHWVESSPHRRVYMEAYYPVSRGEVEEGVLLYERTYGIKPVSGIIFSDGKGNLGVLLNGAPPDPIL